MNGPEPFGAVTGRTTQGLVIDVDTGRLKSVFNGDGDGFQNPHDLAVSPDGTVLYEAELRPFRVWKLANGEGGGVEGIMKRPSEGGVLGRLAEALWGFMG